LNTKGKFRLISLTVKGNHLLGSNTFSFIDDKDIDSSIYSTVIIGANGTGKSNLFRLIIEIFRELWLLQNSKGKSQIHQGIFKLKYSYNDIIFEFTNSIKIKGGTKDLRFVTVTRNPYRFYKNGERTTANNLFFPKSIIANSVLLTDKYLIPRKPKDGEVGFTPYKYLGVRNRPQQASTRSYIRKTVEFIVENISDKRFIDGVKRVTKFLSLENSLQIIYQTRYAKDYFTGNLYYDDLKAYFGKIEGVYSKNNKIPPFKLNYYRKIRKEKGLIEDICNFVNKLVNSNKLEKIPRSTNKKIKYDVFKDGDLIKNDFVYLEHLRNLGFVTVPEIKFNEGEVKLEQSSSGEYHFFASMIGLLAVVEPYSIVFIDEPEISLHPNWQIKYISFLKNMFSDESYSTCHILIATHSHFLISDLKANSSKILGLTKDNGVLETLEFNSSVDTYGWSAEAILYQIFKVRTTRNYYLDMDLREVLGLISNKSDDVTRIRDILNRFNDVKLDKHDPLNEVIERIEEYING